MPLPLASISELTLLALLIPFAYYLCSRRGQWWNLRAGKLDHGAKLRWADLKASAAFDAFALINGMDKVLTADDRLSWATPKAEHAGLTLVWLDVIGYQWLTDQSRATLLLNMGLILVPEVTKGGKHRVGSGCAQGT